MSRVLLGVETEYAVAAFLRNGCVCDPLELTDLLMSAARDTLVHLPGIEGSGIYLGNGSRLYVDCGAHPELATPECTTPSAAVRYVLAGEKILGKLAAEVASRHPRIESILVLKSNVDYSDSRTTWGCHESYLYRSSPQELPWHIIPHLVSRLIYTGAGGFDSTVPGLEFTLSPRAHHLFASVSDESTTGRGIFHTKNEPLSREGWNRLHLICGESLCSERAAWLKLGTTAIVLAMIDGGVRPGQGMELSSPLAAMRAFASDPSCSVRAQLLRGGMATAVEIQLRYLEKAEAHLGARFMPAWAESVCREWRATIETLREGPEAMSARLDWAIKRALYSDRARRRGFTWESLREWSRASKEIAYALGSPGAGEAEMMRSEILHCGSSLPSSRKVNELLRRKGLRSEELHEFLHLRDELCEIDTRFGQVGEGGIFRALDGAGVLDHRLPGIQPVEEAVDEPPSGSRARLRGELIRRHAKKGTHRCEWSRVWDSSSNRIVDLGDPFEEREVWQGLADSGSRDPLVAEGARR